MARVNTEDCWWTDPRRTALAIRLGSGAKADGAALNAWRLAQEFWGKARGLVPREVFFMLEEAQSLVEFKLADDLGEQGIYIRGTREHLDWIAEHRENAKVAGAIGGKKSAARPRDAKGRLLPRADNTRPESKRNPSDVQAVTKQNPSESKPSSSSSSSGSYEEEKKYKEYTSCTADQSIGLPEVQAMQPQEILAIVPTQPVKRSRFSEEDKVKMRAFIAAYSVAYREKYGAPPEGIREPALVSKIGHWIKTVSEERAVHMVQVYLQISHRYINDECHSLWQFFRHLNRIGNALSTGQESGEINWNKVFGGSVA